MNVRLPIPVDEESMREYVAGIVGYAVKDIAERAAKKAMQDPHGKHHEARKLRAKARHGR